MPPEQIVARVPKELSAVIQRMMAKEPGDRFADMGEVVRTLEEWLGVRPTAGRFAPREEQIAAARGPRRVQRRARRRRPQPAGDRVRVGRRAAGRAARASSASSPWAVRRWPGWLVQAAAAYFVVDGWHAERTCSAACGSSPPGWRGATGLVGRRGRRPVRRLPLAMSRRCWPCGSGSGWSASPRRSVLRVRLDRTRGGRAPARC